MSWHLDILLDERPEELRIRRAMVQLFGITPDEVGIVRSSYESTGAAPVRVVARATRGEFRCMLEIASDQRPTDTEYLRFAQELCRATGVRAWVEDDDINPFTGFIVKPDGSARPASLDPDAEERGEHRLWQERG